MRPEAKQTVLHKLHDTLRTTRHRHCAREPIAPAPLEDMDPPAVLTAEETAAWRYAIEHAPKDWLKCIDRALLALWVKTEARYRRAEAAQAELNANEPLPDLVHNPSNVLVQSPYIGIMTPTTEIMI